MFLEFDEHQNFLVLYLVSRSFMLEKRGLHMLASSPFTRYDLFDRLLDLGFKILYYRVV